jgi:hypothetical protein
VSVSAIADPTPIIVATVRQDTQVFRGARNRILSGLFLFRTFESYILELNLIE